jgi:ribosomal protein S13
VKDKTAILNSKVYICGKEIDGRKTIHYALRSLYGIGDTRAKFIAAWMDKVHNLPPTTLIGNVPEAIIKALGNHVEDNFCNGQDLKKLIDENKELKVKIQRRPGVRSSKSLPLYGRTRSNGRTARRGKKT